MAFPLLLVLLFLFLNLIIPVQTPLPVDATEARRSTVIFSTMTTNAVRSIINKSPSAIVLSCIR